MVILTGAIVLAVPNFANMMALVGATCCTMIAFVLPGIFHMKLFKGFVFWLHIISYTASNDPGSPPYPFVLNLFRGFVCWFHMKLLKGFV